MSIDAVTRLNQAESVWAQHLASVDEWHALANDCIDAYYRIVLPDRMSEEASYSVWILARAIGRPLPDAHTPIDTTDSCL